MCLVEETIVQRDGEMHTERSRRMEPVRSMLGGLRSWCLLVMQSAGQDSGAVVPLCVFQSSDTKYPLNKGSPDDLFSRVASGRAHAPPPAYDSS